MAPYHDGVGAVAQRLGGVGGEGDAHAGDVANLQQRTSARLLVSNAVGAHRYLSCSVTAIKPMVACQQGQLVVSGPWRHTWVAKAPTSSRIGATQPHKQHTPGEPLCGIVHYLLVDSHPTASLCCIQHPPSSSGCTTHPGPHTYRLVGVAGGGVGPQEHGVRGGGHDAGEGHVDGLLLALGHPRARGQATQRAAELYSSTPPQEEAGQSAGARRCKYVRLRGLLACPRWTCRLLQQVAEASVRTELVAPGVARCDLQRYCRHRPGPRQQMPARRAGRPWAGRCWTGCTRP